MKTYIFNEKDGILEVKTKQTITIHAISMHYSELARKAYLPRDLLVLVDCSQVNFNLKPMELSDSIEELGRALVRYQSIREAIVLTQPYETAVATLFKKFSQGFDNYHFEMFYTKIAAIDWLTQKHLLHKTLF